MKSKIFNYIIKSSVTLIFILISTHLLGQDLGVVWQKNNYTTNKGYFTNVLKQDDGTYLACGYIIKDNFMGSGKDRQVGYVVQFDEAGQKLNEWILAPSSENNPQWTDGNGTAKAELSYAFINEDGDLVAFGTVLNKYADQNIKGHNVAGVSPVENNEYLKDGIWIIRVKKDNSNLVLYNAMSRGNSIVADVIKFAPDQYIMTGYDYQDDLTDNFLFRVFQAERGKTDMPVIYDNMDSDRLKYDWARKMFKLPNGNLTITSYSKVCEYKYTGSSLSYVRDYVNALNWGEECMKKPTISPDAGPAVGDGYYAPDMDWTFKPDGNFFIMGRMAGVFKDGTIKNYGSVFYERKADNTLLQCQTIESENTPQTLYYSAPYLSQGSSSKYVGTVIKNDGLTYMYLCLDKPGDQGFQIINTNFLLPYITRIVEVSHSDGFFSAGQDQNGFPALAKLSSCANFKVTNLPVNNRIEKVYEPIININKEFNYVGAIASRQNDVAYSFTAEVASGTVNGKNSGDVLERIVRQPVDSYVSVGGAGSGKLFDLNRTYSISNDAVIKYTLTIHDSYQTSGIPQHCNQTYIFYFRPVGLADVVAMPIALRESANKIRIKTSIKNIGKALLSNPYQITIYKDNLGNAIKYTYQYDTEINVNETVDFDFDVTGSDWDGVNRIIVSFNDDGSGSASNNRQTYTVDF